MRPRKSGISNFLSSHTEVIVKQFDSRKYDIQENIKFIEIIVSTSEQKRKSILLKSILKR